jgi:ubiquinone biosynthesis protein
VVVEGVSRSLYPNINIWEVARPVVEDYIRRNVGPRALLNDLVRTAQVLGRFGPKLPQLVEDALARQNTRPPEPARPAVWTPVIWTTLGGLLTAGAIWLGTVL